MLERTGDVSGALNLILQVMSIIWKGVLKLCQRVDVCLTKLKSVYAAIPYSEKRSRQSGSFLQVRNLVTVVEAEASAILHVAIQLCQRNSSRLEEQENEVGSIFLSSGHNSRLYGFAFWIS